MLNIKNDIKDLSFHSKISVDELRAFDPDIRNKIRAITAYKSKGDVAIKLLNNLRDKLPVYKLVRVENFLRSFRLPNDFFLLSELYPSKPQTYNNYIRLKSLGINRQIEYIENLLILEEEKILDFFDQISKLNEYIFDNDLRKYDSFKNILNRFGYSHFLLRKSVAIKIFDRGFESEVIDKLINDCGIGKNNVVVSSLFQCYQAEQDYISLKKSVMNFPDRKERNKYIRDIIRVPFSPTCSDKFDLCDLTQSCLQSSLIDSLIILYINKKFVSSKYLRLNKLFSVLSKKFKDDSKIVKYYFLYDNIDNVEDIFYKQSSAWFEYDFINDYRILPDNFYDDPNAIYVKITSNLIDKIKNVNVNISLNDLSDCNDLKTHNYENLKLIENTGIITRSSLFNFIIYNNKGNDIILDNNLYSLMSITKDLSRTINIEYIRNLASFAESIEAKIIYYLLISKKSENQAEDYMLRKLIQKVVIDKHNSSLLDYIKSMYEKNPEIANYIYETCTESFIARLSHLITSISQITATRAALHQWMGEVTGEKSFIDRARTILIDQQIKLTKTTKHAKRHFWLNDVCTCHGLLPSHSA